MTALPAVGLDADRPVLLPVGRDLVRRAMGARGLTVTALAAELGGSRKHLSNVLNGHAPLIEPLAQRLADATGADPVLLRATARPPRRAKPARHGFMKGWIVVSGRSGPGVKRPERRRARPASRSRAAVRRAA